MVRFRASLVRYIRDLSLVSAATPAVIWQTQRYYVFRWISEVTQSFFYLETDTSATMPAIGVKYCTMESYASQLLAPFWWQ